MPNTLCRIPETYVFIKLTLHTCLGDAVGRVQALNRLNSFRNEDSKSVLPKVSTIINFGLFRTSICQRAAMEVEMSFRPEVFCNRPGYPRRQHVALKTRHSVQ